LRVYPLPGFESLPLRQVIDLIIKYSLIASIIAFCYKILLQNEAYKWGDTPTYLDE